jgi:hypothetical protein
LICEWTSAKLKSGILLERKKENIDNPAYAGLLDVFRRGEKIVL